MAETDGIRKRLERVEGLLEYIALVAVANSVPVPKGQRLRDLEAKLWPQGLVAEHARNPMNHMGRSRS